jgi:hypothetical protein
VSSGSLTSATTSGASVTTSAAVSEVRRELAHRRRSRHAVYVELLGRGGLWGAGYDYAILPRLALGAIGAFQVHDGERLTTFSPYLTWYPLGSGHHRLFAQGGPQVVHLATPSPVPEWDGKSEHGVGAQVAVGWEYRDGFLLRTFAMATAGKGGAAPWVGVNLGWSW